MKAIKQYNPSSVYVIVLHQSFFIEPMNTTNSTSSTVWRRNISVPVTSYSRHSHKPNPISAGFVPPQANKSLVLTPVSLAASIARTVTLRNAPPEMLARWAQKSLIEIEWLIQDSSTFELSPFVHQLADAERTAFAASMGAGVTDLVMNGLGYTWRDNAAAIPGSSLSPHADFLYGDGAVSGHGVVLAEAHGSLAATVSLGAIEGHAKRKYRKQVKPHLGAPSIHGKIIHGYSVAFGSRPTAAGAFLHIAETRVAKPKKAIVPVGSRLPTNPSQVSTSLALSTHRANFSLMGSPTVARWIDWLRFRDTEPEDDSAEFIRIPYAGRIYLASADWCCHPDDWDYWHRMCGRHLFISRQSRRWLAEDFAGIFAIEESAAEQFLDSLSSMLASAVGESTPDTLTLPSFDPIGFGVEERDQRSAAERTGYSFALFRDGLALLGTPPGRSDGYRIWQSKKGLLKI